MVQSTALLCMYVRMCMCVLGITMTSSRQPLDAKTANKKRINFSKVHYYIS